MVPRLHFDSKAKIISLRLNKKESVNSEIKGKLVIDYDVSGEIVNLEIMSFSLDEFGEQKEIRRPIPEITFVGG